MLQMHTVVNCVAACYLLAGTGWDIKSRKIPGWYLLAGSAGVIIFRFCVHESRTIEYAAGAAAGILFAGISMATKEKLGYGDSWMIGILGIFFGIQKLMGVLFIAFLLSACAAGYCIVWKKYRRQEAIPFYPFLFLGFAGGILL